MRCEQCYCSYGHSEYYEINKWNLKFCSHCNQAMQESIAQSMFDESEPTPLPKESAMIITVVKLKTGFAIDHKGKELVRLINQRALFAHLKKKFGMDNEAIHSIQSVLHHDAKVDINLDHVGAA